MKRFILIITFVCIASVSILMFTECAVSPPGYYINFKVDDVQKNFNKGLTDVEEKPFGVQIPSGTEIFANPNVVSRNNETEYLYFHTGIYDVGTETGELQIFYVTETEVSYESQSDTHTLTISTYESEGGVIEGTFSATVESDGFGDKEITEGEFRVKRLADNTVWQPD